MWRVLLPRKLKFVHKLYTSPYINFSTFSNGGNFGENKEEIKLRPYQIECVEACESGWDEGKNKQLVMLPVASGKTVVMAFLIKKLFEKNSKQKILVLAHRTELLQQARNSNHSICFIFY